MKSIVDGIIEIVNKGYKPEVYLTSDNNFAVDLFTSNDEFVATIVSCTMNDLANKLTTTMDRLC